MLYEIRATTCNGQGVFATQDIPCGTIIISETPLLLTSNQDLLKNLKALSPESLAKFYTLHNCKSLERPLEQGIWYTNCFKVSSYEDNTKSENGVFEIACRINHSCCPNAEYDWKKEIGRMEIVTKRNLKRGEEITHSYIEFLGHESVHDRRRRLQGSWNFLCRCERCLSELR